MELLPALLLVLISARALGEGFRRLHQAPLIGEVLAGLILGPSILNLVSEQPNAETWAGLGIVAMLGVFFLVLVAGMEVGHGGLRQALKERTAIVAVVEFLFPFYFGYLLAQTLNLSMLASLFLATGMAVTALPVSVRILMDLGLTGTRLGRAIVSVAVANDVTAFAILGVLLALHSSQGGEAVFNSAFLSIAKVFIFIMFLMAISWFLRMKGPDGRPRLAVLTARLRPPEATFALIIILALGMGTLAELLGIYFAIGVFYAGVFLTVELVGVSQLPLVRNTVQSVGLGFLAPIFFAFVGLRVSLSSVDWPLVAIVTTVAFFGKVLGGAVGGYAAGFRGRQLAALGVGLNARGMMELILAEIGLESGIITQSLYSAIVFMTLITTLSAPLIMRALLKDVTEELPI